MQLSPGAKLHLLGIGGVGMSPLAHLAAERGFEVSGSDARDSPRMARLRAAGIAASSPHAAIPSDCELVACSPALAPTHPLRAEARARALPILHRAELLAALLPRAERVAIAGTHGKSTTTAMLAHVLLAAGRDPSVVLGAHAPGLAGGHRHGREALALFEACEGYGALDHTPAPWACVTNIDDDHVEQFSGFEAIVASFSRLCAGASQGLVLGVDDARLRAWAASPQLDDGRPLRSFALDVPAQVRGLRDGPNSCELHIDGAPAGRLQLRSPGAHNLRNALGAIAMAQLLGLDPREASVALAHFEGVSRRLELVGHCAGVPVLDDYAHHPSEVAAAIEAARSQWPRARLLVVFQPHLPSRERRLRARFAAALAAADLVFVTPTYAARESAVDEHELPLVAELQRRGHPCVHALTRLDMASEPVRAQLHRADLVLVMGAGSISALAHELAAG